MTRRPRRRRRCAGPPRGCPASRRPRPRRARSSGRVRSSSRSDGRADDRDDALRPVAECELRERRLGRRRGRGRAARPGRSSAARASSPASNGSQTNASTTSTSGVERPAQLARCRRPASGRSLRVRADRAGERPTLIRGFDGLARAGGHRAHDAAAAAGEGAQLEARAGRRRRDRVRRPRRRRRPADSHEPIAGDEPLGVRGQEHPSVGGQGGGGRPREGFEVVLESPYLAGRAVPVGRRVEDDAVVAPFSTDLARDESPGVVDQPADRSVGEPVQRGVPSRPGDRRLAASTCATEAPRASASVPSPV